MTMTNSNCITLVGIEAETLLGVYDWERTHLRPIIIDIKMHLPDSQRFTVDDLAHTIDYQAVSECLKSLCQKAHFQLLETLAEYLIAAVLNAFKVPTIELTVHKPDVLPQVKDVSVTLVRHA